MKRSILILVLVVLLSQIVYSQTDIDSDNDGTPNTSDKFPLDYDNDGMPDSWEKSHGLRWDINDARLDRDKDGTSNLEEYKESLVVKKSFLDKLKEIPKETILIVLLIIGIGFILIGIIGMIIRKRRVQFQYLGGVLNVKR